MKTKTKYQIEWSETLFYTQEIEADTPEEAENKWWEGTEIKRVIIRDDTEKEDPHALPLDV